MAIPQYSFDPSKYLGLYEQIGAKRPKYQYQGYDPSAYAKQYSDIYSQTLGQYGGKKPEYSTTLSPFYESQLQASLSPLLKQSAYGFSERGLLDSGLQAAAQGDIFKDLSGDLLRQQYGESMGDYRRQQDVTQQLAAQLAGRGADIGYGEYQRGEETRRAGIGEESGRLDQLLSGLISQLGGMEQAGYQADLNSYLQGLQNEAAQKAADEAERKRLNAGFFGQGGFLGTGLFRG